MISLLGKYKNVILIIVILAFLSGVGYVGYGAYSAGAADRGAAALVGTEKIKTYAVDRLVKDQETQLRRQGKDLEEADMEVLKQQALQGLMEESALAQGAEKYGLRVSDFELAYAVKTSPLFNTGGGFDKKAYVWAVRNQFNMSPADFEQQQRRAMLTRRFVNLLASAERATPEEIKYNFKTQYGSLKDFDAKKADFIPTVQETKADGALNAFLADFNAHNSVKVFVKE